MRYALSPACTCTEKYEPEHTYTFTGPCLKTGKPYSVTVPADGLHKYHQGAYIQDAFPNLSKDDREFLMSGYSPEGWKEIFGDDDDESQAVSDCDDDGDDAGWSDPPGGEGG